MSAKTAPTPDAASVAALHTMLKHFGTLAKTAVIGEAVPVLRSGKKIIIPEGMGYDEAHIWLQRQEEAEEKTVNVVAKVECFPLDGVVALSRAFREIYGFTDLRGAQSFFGERPPTVVDVPTGVNETEAAPLGRIQPPKWDGGYLEANIDGPSVVINGVVKRKFEEEARAIIAKTKTLLVERSIYRGKAVHMDLSWYDGSRPFDVFADSPRFMQTSETRLILNPTTRFELETSIFMLIENTEACRANKIPLKHGALLMGTFGTGKTMTAKALAYKCEQNDWTFIYLKRAQDLANGLRVAKMYAPAVVFVEDIDTVVNDRDETMNDLLNTLDGVDTKNSPIITVLTTNKPEEIEPSFMRAGRIDSLIRFGLPEPDTAIQFIQLYAGENLDPQADLAAAGAKMAGLVPAFITEAVSKAKRYAIQRTGNPDITGQVNTEDLALAAASVQDHIKWQRPKAKSKYEVVVEALQLVENAKQGNLPEGENEEVEGEE